MYSPYKRRFVDLDYRSSRIEIYLHLLLQKPLFRRESKARLFSRRAADCVRSAKVGHRTSKRTASFERTALCSTTTAKSDHIFRDEGTRPKNEYSWYLVEDVFMKYRASPSSFLLFFLRSVCKNVNAVVYAAIAAENAILAGLETIFLCETIWRRI